MWTYGDHRGEDAMCKFVPVSSRRGGSEIAILSDELLKKQKLKNIMMRPRGSDEAGAPWTPQDCRSGQVQPSL